jgi:hypothetical protein
MILVAPKWILKEYLNRNNRRVEAETYRLINTIIDNGNVYAVCERLSDELVLQSHLTVEKFKGDLFLTTLKDIRVIRNSDFEENEIKREREEALKELHLVLNGNNKPN